MQYIGYLLVIIHLFLLAWGLGGFTELVFSAVPWKPFTNQDFPTLWLPVHWGSVLITSIGFLYGYFRAWSKTPVFMMATYGMLALVCAVETFVFLTNKTKFVLMGTEYLTYTLILFLLFKSTYFINFFGQQENKYRA